MRTATVDELVQQLRDYKTRGRARGQLLRLGTEPADSLLDLLRDTDAPENARWAAMTVLAEMGYRPAGPVLIDLLAANSTLAGEAGRALHTITGADHGVDVEAWRRDFGLSAGDVETSGPEEHIRSMFADALKEIATEYTWETADQLYVRFALDNERKQQLVIALSDPDLGMRMVQFYTEAGNAPDDAETTIARRNMVLNYGAFSLETEENGQRKVVMRHEVSLDELTVTRLRDIAVTMAGDADGLESAMSGADHI